MPKKRTDPPYLRSLRRLHVRVENPRTTDGALSAALSDLNNYTHNQEQLQQISAAMGHLRLGHRDKADRIIMQMLAEARELNGS